MSEIATSRRAMSRPSGCADVERDAALAGVLVVELAAHVGVGHAGQRRRSRARRASRPPTGRHRAEAGVGIGVPLDLDALGAERGEEAGAAGRGEEPGEVEDAHAVERHRLCRAADGDGSARRRSRRRRSRPASRARSSAAGPSSVSSPRSGARRPTTPRARRRPTCWST